MTRSRLRGEGGFAAVEVAILAPVLIALGFLVVATGRVAGANSKVDAAAYAAARAASIARTADTAQADAQAAAAASLTQAGQTCAPATVVVDTSGFAIPAGTPATITVRLSCAVPLSDLTMLPGLTSTKVIAAQAVSSLDTYRGRS